MTSGRGFPGQRTSKKLMLRVRPGVELVRASFESTRVLITLDFPTFELPRNATSGKLGAGKWATSVAAATNCAITLMRSEIPFLGALSNQAHYPGHLSVQCGRPNMQAVRRKSG